MSNSFGDLFKVTIFGESHGKVMGGVVDGCVPGLTIDEQLIHQELLKRSTSRNFFSSPRIEADDFEILSGICNGKTTGGPISFIILNANHKKKDYDELDKLFRPSHADFTYFAKYGSEESAGKLNASGRIFAPVVLAGSLAKQFIQSKGISVMAYVKQIGNVALEPGKKINLNTDTIEASKVRCPDSSTSEKMLALLTEAKEKGDSLGGIISCVVKGCEPGLGDPLFDKLSARLAHAMLSVHSVKGFEYGSGFAGAGMWGSEHNDPFIIKNKRLQTLTNHSGGIQGGISNGMDICFNVAFKPISSIAQKQKTISREAAEVEFAIKGRHDVCIVPRAVPIIESMTALVLADSYLKNLPYAE
ncbi:MAG: chorismate synthase [Bacteroidota bacterium]